MEFNMNLNIIYVYMQMADFLIDMIIIHNSFAIQVYIYI